MRTNLAAAMAVEPLSLHADGSSPEAGAYGAGEEVVLAAGTYRGTLGIFRQLRSDVNWADIAERNGNIRSHPVAWLAHSTSATAGFSKEPGERR
jgi:hypothetical protein